MASTDQGSLLSRATRQKIFSSSAFWQAAWQVLYFVLVSSFLYASFSHWNFDETFITYRYASNLLHGLGFVYNVGERVLSTTTPLYVFLLAFFSAFWSNIPRLASLIGAFSLAASGLLFWELGRQWEMPIAGWVGLALYPTFPLLVSTLDTEIPLYLALCLSAFVFFERRQWLLTAVFCALAFLTRPDGLLVAFVLAVVYALRLLQTENNYFQFLKKLPWKAVLLFLAITLPWIIFSWIYFGSPFPATLSVRLHQGAMLDSQFFTAGFVQLLRSFATQWLYWIEAGLAILGLALSHWRLRRWWAPWVTIFFWTLLYYRAYASFDVPHQTWYYVPLVPAFIVAVGLGVAVIPGQKAQDELVPEKIGAPHLWYSTSPVFIFVTVVIALLLMMQVNALLKPGRIIANRPDIYRAVGEWLRQNTPPEASIGTRQAGTMGYYAKRQMIDFSGLLQPRVARKLDRQPTYDQSALFAIQRYHPDYLVLEKGDIHMAEVYALQLCRLVQTMPGAAYDQGPDVNIYQCTSKEN